MPELPEVQALAADLATRLADRAIARLDVVAFAALKTFAPPPSALQGLFVDGVGRRGKFLDIQVDGLHLVIHLARGGWIRWRQEVPALPPRPGGKNPLAARVVLDNGSGLDITEAGTQKRLAIYVVAQSADVPGIARLGPDPLADAFTRRGTDDILQRAGRAQIKGVLRDQAVIAGIGNAYSDEILHAAKMSPFKPCGLTADDVQHLYDAMQASCGTRSPVARASRPRAQGREEGQTSPSTGVPGPLPRLWRHRARGLFADSSLQYCPTCQTGGKPLADRRLSRLLK